MTVRAGTSRGGPSPNYKNRHPQTAARELAYVPKHRRDTKEVSGAANDVAFLSRPRACGVQRGRRCLKQGCRHNGLQGRLS